jgi:hypothetical protein
MGSRGQWFDYTSVLVRATARANDAAWPSGLA